MLLYSCIPLNISELFPLPGGIQGGLKITNQDQNRLIFTWGNIPKKKPVGQTGFI
jgi:hypothetical protein